MKRLHSGFFVLLINNLKNKNGHLHVALYSTQGTLETPYGRTSVNVTAAVIGLKIRTCYFYVSRTLGEKSGNEFNKIYRVLPLYFSYYKSATSFLWFSTIYISDLSMDR